jgi:ParB family chromosome partitioning protein
VKRKALGRGLAALLGEPESDSASSDPAPRTESSRDYFQCSIEDVHPMRDQPRRVFDETALEELAASIRVHGILQPLAVRERKEGGFWLIAGERRWRASQRAGLHRVPVVVREASPTHAFELALIENLQRADLSPIEEAEAYRRLVSEHGYTQEQLAERVGKDRSTVANALRLLKLPDGVRDMVQSGRLSMGHARALLSVPEEQIERLARRAAERGLSVRQVEELARGSRSARAPHTATKANGAAQKKSAGARDVENRLSRALGTRVEVVEQDGGAGRIEIAYHSLDALDRLLDRLLGH